MKTSTKVSSPLTLYPIERKLIISWPWWPKQVYRHPNNFFHHNLIPNLLPNNTDFKPRPSVLKFAKHISQGKRPNTTKHSVTVHYAIFFSVPLFGLRIFLLIFIFHFENLSKFIIFSNEDVRRTEPHTNNHKSNYRTTRPARDELPDLRF